MPNCATCGQACSDPITVKEGKKTRHFCSGDCELMFSSQGK
ncbi:MAG: hypothetical protein QXJ74_04210 [Nitrososphaera sp.]|nr:hypothetical protein [Nitrososphaera sp.]